MHTRDCRCFDCKNGYTKVEDQAKVMFRKWRKPIGKRKNREILQKQVAEIKKAKKLSAEQHNAFKFAVDNFA